MATAAVISTLLAAPSPSPSDPRPQATPETTTAGRRSVDGRAVTGEQVAKTAAGAWHDAGHTGAGVKVGIIDGFDQPAWNAAVAAGDLPQPAGTFCRVDGQPCDIWTDDADTHGVGVAEIIADMAPGVQFYLANAATTADTRAAIDYFAGQGVKVVNRSLGGDYDGPGDGTGPSAAVVDHAVAQGIAFFNAAGNEAGSADIPGRYWRGRYADADGDGWIEFAPGDETLSFGCGDAIGLRWSDWGESGVSDYDLYVFDTAGEASSLGPYPDSTGAAIAASKAAGTNDQGAGADPVENYGIPDCAGEDDVDFLRIGLFDPGTDATDDLLEFMLNLTDLGEHWSNPFSASTAYCDTANPGGVCVGAIDPPRGSTIAFYSNRGPTNDGRIKPDLVAATAVQTTSAGVFNGTSGATPVVVGAAALAIGAGLTATPAEVKTFLLDRATVDRGTPGPDNVYGHGELRLPAPPALGPFRTVGAFVRQQYLDFLGRQPDQAGEAFWRRQIAAGVSPAALIESFLRSNEFGARVAPVTRLYFAYFLRIPDSDGLLFWIGRARQGTPLASISNAFASSNEFAARYGSLTNEEFVRRVFQNVLGRDPDGPGLAFWTAELNSGRRTRGEVMIGFSESVEYVRGMDAEVTVTMVYVGMLRRAPDAGGFGFWVGRVDAIRQLIAGFIASGEYGARFG